MNSLRKQFLHYMLPSIAAMWVFSLYTMVDGIFVAKGVGPTAMAAVNISMPFINTVFAIALLFATGTSTIIAIALGQNKIADARQIFSLTSIVMIVIGIIVTILAYTNIDALARFLGSSEGTHQYVVDYLGIIVLFGLCFILGYAYEVLVKTDGFPFMATFVVIGSALTNVILDYVFILQFGWGIKGAAIATGLSQLFATIIFLIHFMGKKTQLRFQWPDWNFSIFKRILPIGFADCITELATAFTIFLFNQAILRVIGESGIVSFTVITYLNTLVVMTMVGITQGMQPLVSFYYGREERKSYTYLFRIATKTVAIVSVLYFLLSIFGANKIVGIFLAQEEIHLFPASVHAVMLYSSAFLLVGFNILTSGYFSALEMPKYSLTLAVLRGFICITLSLVVMTLLLQDTGIWLAAAVSEFLCLIASFVCYKKYAEHENREAAPQN